MNLNEAKQILKENNYICEDLDKNSWAGMTSNKIAQIEAIEYAWSETKGNHFIQFNHRIGDPTTLGVFYKPHESRPGFEGAVTLFDVKVGYSKKEVRFTPENSTPDEVAKAVKKAKLEADDQYIIRFSVEDPESDKVKNAVYKFVTEFAKQVDSWNFGGIKHKFKPVSYKAGEEDIYIRCKANDIYGNIEELDKFWNRNIKVMEKAGVYTMNATFRETDFDNYKPFEEEEKNESVKVKNALKYLKENGYQINEDLPAKDQDAFQWRTFRKDANKILAGFAAKFIELATTELIQESGEAVDMNELWDSVGGKDEFIKTLITDENEVLLDYVGELWQAANNAKNLNIK